MSVEIIAPVMRGVVVEFAPTFKLFPEFLGQRVVNGQNQRVSGFRRQKRQRRFHQAFHPVGQRDFAVVERVVERFQFKRRDFGDETLKIGLDRLKSVQRQYGQR